MTWAALLLLFLALLPRHALTLLGYCPPLELLGSLGRCRKEVALQEGMMLSFLGHAEELEWAVAEASEAGATGVDWVLSFTEALHLLLCISRHRCLYPSEAGFKHSWDEACEAMLARAPDFDGKFAEEAQEACRHGHQLMDLMGKLVDHIKVSSRRDHDRTLARYPADVSPACADVSVPPALSEWHAELELTGTYGTHVLSSALPSVADVLSQISTPIGKTASDLVVINLGAHDGTCSRDVGVTDAANCAFDRGAKGLAVEGLAVAQDLEGRWPGVEVHVGYVSPENATSLILANIERHRHKGIDLLKIDLDHADCFFGEAILQAVPAPRMLVVEYNRVFPPPIRMRERFSDVLAGQMGHSWLDGKWRQHWSGCSIQAWHDVAAAMGFQLLQADLLDLVFVRRDVAVEAGLSTVPGQPGALFNTWLSAAHCFAPARRLYGHQAFASLDLRALAELGVDARCALAEEWRQVEEEASAGSELYC